MLKIIHLMSNPILPTEKIVETKKCLLSGKEFVITDKDLEFYDKISPTFDGKKYQIPTPKLCPEERQKRRLTFRNERKLYKRKCSATGKELISNHKSEAEYPVFSRDYWLSDKYNPADYGRKFDFSKPFFTQYYDFQKTVPRIHIQQIPPFENSDYANYMSNCRDCYLVFDSDFNEKCYYDTRIAHCKDTLDSCFCEHCEQCFECIQCQKSQKLFYCTYCVNCRDSWFLDSCIGCQDCLFCCNLVNKQYCFMNEQLTKDAYKEKMKQVFSDSNIGKRRELFVNFAKKNIKKFIHGAQIDNSLGDDLYNVRNVKQCFGMTECEDCAFCDLMNTSKNCYDVSSFGENASWIYETSTAGLNVNNCLFGQMNVNNSSNLIYCDMIQSSRDCFGSISLKK